MIYRIETLYCDGRFEKLGLSSHCEKPFDLSGLRLDRQLWTDIRNAAKAAGWVRKYLEEWRTYYDLCPECAALYNQSH